MPRRKPRGPQSVASLLITAALVIAYLIWHSYQVRKTLRTSGPGQPTANLQTGPNDLLGRPRFESARPSDQDYFLDKGFYVLSYNSSNGTPNWVSWRLTREDLGSAPRKQVFDADDTLPPGLRKIQSNDYRSAGFDRGHMCPHSDRSSSQAASFSTFVMTNIVPQAPNLNQRAWEQLESYGRSLAREGKRLYIVCGPAGQGGTGKEGFRKTIAKGKVTVPASCWKIIVVVGQATGNDLAAIDAQTRVIAVNMPNDNAVGDTWAQYRTSVAAIEQLTGLVFFTNLPTDVAAALKNRVDQQPVPAPGVHSWGGE